MFDTPDADAHYPHDMARPSAGVNVEWVVSDHRDVVHQGLRTKQHFAETFFLPSRDRRARLIKQFQDGTIVREQPPFDVLTIMLLRRSHLPPGTMS